MKNLFKLCLVSISCLFVGSLVAQTYNIGDEVADFSLKNVDGKMVSMSQYQDAKGFILVFSCNTCPFVVASDERIKELNKQYKPMGYPLLAINSNDTEVSPADTYDKMVAKAKKEQFGYPYLVDANQKQVAKFGATKTPEVYILKKENGKLILKYTGAIDDSPRDPEKVSEKFVEEAMASIISGKPIAKNKTKAVGCTIKFKK